MNTVKEFIQKLKTKTSLANKFLIEEKKPESYLSSFIGRGKGYLPKGFKIPEKRNLILQINFSEMHLLENFPCKGILQVWASGDQMFEKEKEENDGLIIFHKDTSLKQQEIELEIYENIEDPFYFEKPYSISFEEQELTFPSLDTNEFKFFENDFINLNEEEKESIYEEYEELELPVHYIGGFPYFTQSDPREDNEIPIIQLGYCEHLCIGDAGTFQIFIKKEDLINLNFENAWCYWDCC